MTNLQNTTDQSKLLNGDKILWAAIIAISIASIFVVYSASSNLAYVGNNGTVREHITKHIGFIVVGFCLMRAMGLVKYKIIGKLSTIGLIVMLLALVYTIFSGKVIDGASASRWMKIPFTSITFQPSTMSFLVLIIYMCRYIVKNLSAPKSNLEHIFKLFLPIIAVFGLVFKDNGSTGLMIYLVTIIVLIIGQFNWKFIVGYIGVSLLFAVVFLLVALNTTWLGEHRVNTWKSRIETFTTNKAEQDTTVIGKNGEKIVLKLDRDTAFIGHNGQEIIIKKKSSEESDIEKAKKYQMLRAKAAIINGSTFGTGPGKSALKQMLPQSASDFVFAIIVEEYGLFGSSVLILLYFIIIFRVIIIAKNTSNLFGSLLVLSIGIMIFVQIGVNIAVAVNLIPVTGQPLPLVSYGGTSMLVTYIQLGIILNISNEIQLYNENGIGKQQSLSEINDIA